MTLEEQTASSKVALQVLPPLPPASRTGLISQLISCSNVPAPLAPPQKERARGGQAQNGQSVNDDENRGQ
jgi:hypothetical protein